MACPALSRPARWPAVSLAVPQNTGSASAGITLATASTQKLPEAAASALAAAKTSKMPMNRRLRSRCANAAVNSGPASITVNANRVTNCPASDMEIPRSWLSAGSKPTIRNSVVTIKKAENARMAMLIAACRLGVATPGLGSKADIKTVSRNKVTSLLVNLIRISGVISLIG